MPRELLKEIFSHLDNKGLASSACISKLWNDEAEKPQHELSLKVHRLSNDVIKENVQILWNFPEGNLKVDDNGVLCVISSCDIFGRLWKWIQDAYDGRVTTRAQKTAKQTLEGAYHLAACHDTKVYAVWEPKNFLDEYFSESVYKPFHPIPALAECLKNTAQFGETLKETISLIEKNKELFGEVLEDMRFR